MVGAGLAELLSVLIYLRAWKNWGGWGHRALSYLIWEETHRSSRAQPTRGVSKTNGVPET